MLENLQPQRVFYYFEQLCRIPHGSGNTKAISDFCRNFAEQHGLECIQDASDNIIIKKGGSVGREAEAPIILQGHLDMVCEKAPGATIDMAKEGLSLAVDGDMIFAKDTTLGGDDGIAVAMIMAILENDALSHPPLEAVFTADEEIGMPGAMALDCSLLRGKQLLNLDSEEEGCFTLGCAGGITACCHLPIIYEKLPAEEKLTPSSPWQFALSINGLHGGHSGMEINNGYANADILMGQLLERLHEKMSNFRLLSVEGGCKDNAIPALATAKISVPVADLLTLQQQIGIMEQQFCKEYAATEPSLWISLTELNEKGIAPMTVESMEKVISFLRLTPNGVQNMSFDIPGLVKTSLNLGILKTDDKEMTASYSVRSAVATEKQALVEKLKRLICLLGGSFTSFGNYPAWEYRKDAPLQKKMIALYQKQYGVSPKTEIIHAGVECGIFCDKIPDLECVSIGPNILEIHTPRERLEISSVRRVWEFVLKLLAK